LIIALERVLLIVTYFMVLFQVIAENLQKVDPKSDGAKRDWVSIYDECANVLYEVCSSTLITLRIRSPSGLEVAY